MNISFSPKKFIILSYSRTGSNYLISLLNCHPYIDCDGELLSKVDSNPDYASLLSQIYSNRQKIFGFKLFYYHPCHENNEELFNLIKADKSIKIIFLHRKNLLRRYYSLLKARKNGEWKRTKNAKNIVDNEKINISLEELKESLETTINYEKKYMKMFENHNHIEINYEDLESNYLITIFKIFNFLKIRRCLVRSNLVKQNVGKIDEHIENFKEIRDYFQSNKNDRIIFD